MPFTSVLLTREKEYIYYLRNKEHEDQLASRIKKNLEQIPGVGSDPYLLSLVAHLNTVESTDEFDFFSDILIDILESLNSDDLISNVRKGIQRFCFKNKDFTSFRVLANNSISQALEEIRQLEDCIAERSRSTSEKNMLNILDNILLKLQKTKNKVSALEEKINKNNSQFSIKEIFESWNQLQFEDLFRVNRRSNKERKALNQALLDIKALQKERKKYLEPIDSISDNAMLLYLLFINVYPAFGGLNRMNDLLSTSIESTSSTAEVIRNSSSFSQLVNYFKSKNPVDIFFHGLSIASVPSNFIQEPITNTVFTVLGTLGTLRDIQNLSNDRITVERRENIDRGLNKIEDFHKSLQEKSRETIIQKCNLLVTKESESNPVEIKEKPKLVELSQYQSKKRADYEMNVVFCNLNEQCTNPKQIIEVFYENLARTKNSNLILLALADTFLEKGEMAEKLLMLIRMSWFDQDGNIKPEIKVNQGNVYNALIELLPKIDPDELKIFAKTICKVQAYIKLKPLIQESAYELQFKV